MTGGREAAAGGGGGVAAAGAAEGASSHALALALPMVRGPDELPVDPPYIGRGAEGTAGLGEPAPTPGVGTFLNAPMSTLPTGV